jgi:hypothetical protein
MTALTTSASKTNNTSTSSKKNGVQCTVRKNQLMASIPNYGKPYKTFTIQLNNIEQYFGNNSVTTSNIIITTPGTSNTKTGTNSCPDKLKGSVIKVATTSIVQSTTTSVQQQQEQDQQDHEDQELQIQTIEWNKSYSAAQPIFNETSTQSKLIRKMIHLTYTRLYVGTIGITPMKHITLYNSTDLLNTVFKANKYYNTKNKNTRKRTASINNNDTTTNTSHTNETITSNDSSEDNDNQNNTISSRNRIMYTYVILPNGEWRFSKTYHPDYDNVLIQQIKKQVSNFSSSVTGTAIDFMSKHAVMSNCSRHVVYAGEFYILQNHIENATATTTNINNNNNTNNSCNNDKNNAKNYEHVLIIDNGSGTYAPETNNGQLQKLTLLLQHNFPGLKVIAHHYNDPVTTTTLYPTTTTTTTLEI